MCFGILLSNVLPSIYCNHSKLLVYKWPAMEFSVRRNPSERTNVIQNYISSSTPDAAFHGQRNLSSLKQTRRYARQFPHFCKGNVRRKNICRLWCNSFFFSSNINLFSSTWYMLCGISVLWRTTCWMQKHEKPLYLVEMSACKTSI